MLLLCPSLIKFPFRLLRHLFIYTQKTPLSDIYGSINKQSRHAEHRQSRQQIDSILHLKHVLCHFRRILACRSCDPQRQSQRHRKDRQK